MAVPSAITKSSLVREALSSVGQLTNYSRAITHWFEEVKLEISRRRKWEILETQQAIPLTKGDSDAALPIDYSETIRLTYFRGDATGSVTLISGNQVTLSAGETITQPDAETRILFLFASGVTEHFQITSYNPTTKIATLNGTPTITGTPSYMVHSSSKVLEYVPVERNTFPKSGGTPTTYSIFSSTIKLDRGPTETNTALVFEYHIDLNLLDEAGTTFTRILREWRMAFLHGIKYRSYLEVGDQRSSIEFGAFEQAISRLMRSEGRKRQPRRSIRWRSPGGIPRRRY